MCIASNPSCLEKRLEAGPNRILLSPTVLDPFPERLVHTEAMKASRQAQCVTRQSTTILWQTLSSCICSLADQVV